LARRTEALCDDVICSAVSCTNTDELHERLYAPSGLLISNPDSLSSGSHRRPVEPSGLDSDQPGGRG
jgi:hypothetical protein